MLAQVLVHDYGIRPRTGIISWLHLVTVEKGGIISCSCDRQQDMQGYITLFTPVLTLSMYGTVLVLVLCREVEVVLKGK